MTLSHGSESGEGGNDSDASLDDLKSQFLPGLYTCTVYITDLQTNLFYEAFLDKLHETFNFMLLAGSRHIIPII